MGNKNLNKVEASFRKTFDEFIDLSYERALAVVTGMFVSLAVAVVESHGNGSDGDIEIDGGENRDITIHAVKSMPPVENHNWNPVTQKPENSGSYLVVLREGNDLGWTHKQPVIAEYDLWTDKPNYWTAFNPEHYENEVINDDVLWWSELPEVPKNPPFNVWIDWEYTPENPYPKLDGDPLVHVRFGDLSESNIERGIDARPIGYWHDDGDDTNDFAWLTDSKGGYKPSDNSIIAYMLVDPNNHD